MPSPPTERVRQLRQHALDTNVPGIRSAEGELHWYRGWMANQDASSHLVRRALAKKSLLTNATPRIDPGELLVGKPNYRQLTDDELAEWEHYRRYAAPALNRLQGQGSHMAIDYEKLLRLGICGIQQQIHNRRARLALHLPEDMQKDEFYQAGLTVLDGVLDYADHYAVAAEHQAGLAIEATRRAELQEIAQTCRHVPRHPARTFREALQSIHFVTVCLEGLYQLGRPDRYLLRYYQDDLQCGRLCNDAAQELIDCLCLLYSEYIPKGLAVGLMVGGRDGYGGDTTNPLTYMFIDSIEHTRLAYPGVGLCYTTDTPEDLLERCAQLLGQGLSHPALFNDDVITKGLFDLGLPPHEACAYIHSTCVEITPIASSGVWVASPYINLVQILLDVLEGPTQQITSYDALQQSYRHTLAETIAREVVQQNRIQMERHYHGGDPLVSCFVNDCLSRGRDIDQGGARYNWIMPSFVGLANLIDSFITMRTLVFDNQELSLEQFVQILRDNFDGQERLLKKIQNKIKKYGNDEDDVDQLAAAISGWVADAVSRHRTYRDDRFVPSFFCWIMHEQLGRTTGASPDGRLAGFPLGDGSGPAQGREQQGPTASILSSTKWDHAPFIGGIAINMKLSRHFFGKPSLPKFLDLVRTFMARGGFEMQINVVDKDTLLQAREHPDQYGDLVVRVGGYSDYFIHLPPKMQEEVILRTEHTI